jgi:Kdo2-lipid IVA lauroyltransferase/acyltransferase
MSDAIVLPARLRHDQGGHVLQIFPPLEGFPSGDDAADAAGMNRAIEGLIADDPAPYWWCLERFRKRPPGFRPSTPARKAREARGNPPARRRRAAIR